MNKLKISKKFKNIVLEHIKFLKKAEWCDIAEAIIEMEIERHSLSEYLNEKQLKEYDILIELYELRKYQILQSLPQKQYHDKILDQLTEMDEQFAVDLEGDGW
jgi:hypothetical protein